MTCRNQAFRHAVAGDDAELGDPDCRTLFRVKAARRRVQGRRTLARIAPGGVVCQPPDARPRPGRLSCVFTGAFDACVRCLDEVEQRLALAESEDTRWQLARVTAVRCSIACFQNDLARAETYADQALRDLPEEDLSFRADIYHALGDTYRRNGRWEEAQSCYLKVLDFAHDPAVPHPVGACVWRAGRSRAAAGAAAACRRLLAKGAGRHPGAGELGPLPAPGHRLGVHSAGRDLYEWNELAEAGDHLLAGLERAELGGDVRALIAGYLLAGRLKLTAGDIAAAAEYLERARPLVEKAPFPDWIGRFERLQLEFWLAQDRLRAAVDWADAMLRGDALEGRPESEAAQLAMARVLIVKGDAPSLERALALLERLLPAAEAEGRAGVQIEALALQALAHWRRGERAGALTSLERALRLAEPEGYVRLFADLGLPMARLLQEARSRDVMPDYVDKLLAACGADLALAASAEQALPEPLTPREQEVLRTDRRRADQPRDRRRNWSFPRRRSRSTPAASTASWASAAAPRPQPGPGNWTCSTDEHPFPRRRRITPLAYPIRGMTASALRLTLAPDQANHGKEDCHVRSKQNDGPPRR